MVSRKQSKRKSVPRSKKGSRRNSKRGSRRRNTASKKEMTGGSHNQSGRGPEMLALLGGIPTVEFFLWKSCPACAKFGPIVTEFIDEQVFDANYIATTVTGARPIIPGIEITSFPSFIASIPEFGISRMFSGVRSLGEINSILLELGMHKAADKVVDSIMPRI
jgi:hypothetical protein